MHLNYLKVGFNLGRQSLICLFSTALVIMAMPPTTYGSGIIKGRVEKRENNFRIGRPVQEGQSQGSNNLQSLGNLSGAPCFKLTSKREVSNISATDFLFSGSPLTSKVENTSPNTFPALLKDASEKDLLVFWEEWHKRISRAIYGQWSTVAPAAGEAHVTLTFRRDRSVTVSIRHYHSLHGYSHDNEGQFIDAVYRAIQSVSGSEELAFPEQSKRQEVVLNACFRSNPYDIASGYSYKHGDVERVNSR